MSVTSGSGYGLFQGSLIRLYGLVQSTGVLNQGIGRWLFERFYWLYKRYFEDSLESFLRYAEKNISPVSQFKQNQQVENCGEVIVYDIGANIGYTSWILSRFFGKRAHLIAVEPEAKNFQSLNHLFKKLKVASQSQAVRAAVGAQAGEINLYQNDGHHADHRVAVGSFSSEQISQLNDGKKAEFQKVNMIGLDEYHEKEFGFFQNKKAPMLFVKIDVQGYELEVLKGMKKMLSSQRPPIVYIEYSPDSMRELGYTQPELTFTFFPKNRFECWKVERREKPEKVDDTKVFQSLTGAYLDLVFVPVK